MSESGDLPEWMTRADICAYLNITVQTFGAYVSRGYFPAADDASERPQRWRRETVVRYAENRMQRKTKAQKRTRAKGTRLPKRAAVPSDVAELLGDDPIARYAAMRLEK